MKSKLNYLISVSLKRKVKSKWFLAANIILCILICTLINIDSVITFFGGDFNENTKIYVLDYTNESFELFKNNIKSILSTNDENNNYDIVLYNKSEKKLKKLVKDKKDTIGLILSYDKDYEATLISKSYLDTLTYSEINQALQNIKVTLSLKKMNLTEQQIMDIYAPAKINRIYIEKDKTSEDENMAMIMTSVFPIVILPFFMLSVFLVQMIGAEVNDEKTTKGMEIIISNVSPKTHFYSKIIAGNLFILMQSALLVLYSVIGIFIRKIIGGDSIMGGVVDNVVVIVKNAMNTSLKGELMVILPLALLLMFLTLIAYSILAGVLASMTTNTEDFQQVQSPIMVICLIGYFLSMMAGVFDGALFIKIVSYIPFISAILSPSLLMLGQIGIIDICISIVLMIGVIHLLIKYGLRIYKVGILNYSSSKIWKKMWKAMKE